MEGVLPSLRQPTFNHYGEYVQSQSHGRLLPHQMNALEALQDWFTHKPNETALTAMPTGSGKTGVICCLPYFLGALKNAQGLLCFPFDKPVLVIAPSLEIANQLEEQILVSSDNPHANFTLKRNIIPPELPQERINDILPRGVKIEETRELNNPLNLQLNNIIIANAQKFLGDKWEGALRDDIFRMVIVDEAHHFPARTWQRIINKFKNHALIAFFTATPYRTDRKSVVEGSPAYYLTLEMARNQGIIRRTKLVEIKDKPLDLKAILREVREIQVHKNTNQALPNNTPHMAMAIAKDITEADTVVQLWNTQIEDGSAIVYHSQVPGNVLQQRMQMIKSNQVKLVVVVDMLREGFDHPPISIAVILTKIVSPVKFTQFVGRAQRIVRSPPSTGSNDTCICHVVTHSNFEQKDNYARFQKEALIEF